VAIRPPTIETTTPARVIAQTMPCVVVQANECPTAQMTIEYRGKNPSGVCRKDG